VDQWRTAREYSNETSECIRSGKFRDFLRNLASQEGLGHGNNNTVISLVSWLVRLLISRLIVSLFGRLFCWLFVWLVGWLAILSVWFVIYFIMGLDSLIVGNLVNILAALFVYFLVVCLVSTSVGYLVVR
jgi:hypothetical protein